MVKFLHSQCTHLNNKKPKEWMFIKMMDKHYNLSNSKNYVKLLLSSSKNERRDKNKWKEQSNSLNNKLNSVLTMKTMTTMLKPSTEKMTHRKKMEIIWINNLKSWSIMQLILTKPISNRLSESTWKTSKKRTDKNFKEF